MFSYFAKTLKSFEYQSALKVYYVTILCERCTFVIFHLLVLYLINDNSSLLFCFLPFFGFFSTECFIFANRYPP
ncbi:hypothetical protein C7379_1144 [Hallella colorans]|uniref:Uncharacterized protein n=1 Tax=Hallella colorans TaxID=1703337 RepID=A0A2U0U4U7_9BACT|nr:hypothetical protein C7379_1144 [Hallella colorans]